MPFWKANEMSLTSESTLPTKGTFSKRILIPVLAFQLLIQLANTGCSIFSVTFVGNWYHPDGKYNPANPILASLVIWIIFSFFALCTIIYQLWAFSTHKLSAKRMLQTQIPLAIYATLFFFLEVLGFLGVVRFVGTSYATFITSIVGFPFFIGSLAYSIVIYRGERAKLAPKAMEYDHEAIELTKIHAGDEVAMEAQKNIHQG